MVKSDSELHARAVALIEERGVSVEDIADLVLHLQKSYVDNLTMEECIENVKAVFLKREVQNAIITGIEIDKLAESGQFSQPLADIILRTTKGSTASMRFLPFRSSTYTGPSVLRTTDTSIKLSPAFCRN